MGKRIGVWLWAVPVLLSSLVFWPVWVFLLVGGLVKVLTGGFAAEAEQAEDGDRGPRVSLRDLGRRGAEAAVAWIARNKYNLLIGSAVLATGLLGALLFFLIEGDGERVTGVVTVVGGYVAIAGLVLGLPALAYAMVTDSAVGRIEEELERSRREDVNDKIGAKLKPFEESLPDHTFQVFVPRPDLKRLLPVYDPEHEGPDEGWGIDRKAPQALSGSAWVGRGYLRGYGNQLRQSKLRLSADQLKRYEDLKAVAAAPIIGRNVDPLGVLTVFSKKDDRAIRDGSFQARHEAAARSLVPIVDDYVPESGALTQQDLSGQG